MSGSSTISDYASGDSLTTEDTSQRCASNDSLLEVRSCGQVENGTPSTSPLNWDTDVDDEDCVITIHQWEYNSIGAQQQVTPANNNACNGAAKPRVCAQCGQATDPRSIAERP